jgi:hypothetical protein
MFVAFVTAVFAVGKDMAHLAFHLPLISMIDWELVTDQLRWIPAGSIMAIFALETEESGVNLWFWVTIFTLNWRPLINLLHMAGLAIDLSMTTFKGEEILMVKMPHPINSIMTLNTILAKLRLVLDNKVPVIKSMAFTARTWIKFVHTVRMAALTADQCSGIILGMLHQAEIRLGMVLERFTF